VTAPGWLTFEPALDRLEALDDVLAEVLRCDDERLADTTAHLVRRGGKRLRPALLFVAAAFGAAAGGSDLLRAAAAVELLHVATLYHDDVMDRAETRRGTRTVNATRGDAAAVAAGTFIFARAIRELVSLDGQLAAWASQSVLALALGQLQEAENTYNTDHRLASYMQISARKTAALFELSCRIGAWLASATPETAERLGMYGRALGLAFQAADDSLDVTAPAGVLGKGQGVDLREGVYGLPILLVLHQHTAEADRLRELLARDELSAAEHQEARTHIADGGGVIGARRIAEDYANQAVAQLGELPGGAAKDSLIRLARYVVLRRH
jgi:heptaprenyl diphosphate synthase component 2